MPTDRTAATSSTTRPRSRFTVPRGLIAGTLVAAALVWGPYALIPRSSLLSAQIQTGLYLALLLLTICSRRAKVLVVRIWQRYVMNPLFKLPLMIGVNPFGLAILETRGHRTGKVRRVPVGNGRKGEDFWIIVEHGSRAGYVHNIRHDPRVRVRLRCGLRYRWVDGIAAIRPDDDPLARQRNIIAWHPMRALNAVNVRVLGADLLVVHIRLGLARAGNSAPAAPGQPAAPAPAAAPRQRPAARATSLLANYRVEFGIENRAELYTITRWSLPLRLDAAIVVDVSLSREAGGVQVGHHGQETSVAMVKVMGGSRLAGAPARTEDFGGGS
jgi:deazaflavin-dependent oxidoreductase (nitroreductase family)